VRAAFGAEALVLNLPSRNTLGPDENLGGDFTMLIAGANGPVRAAFTEQPEYWLRTDRAVDGATLNGFVEPPQAERSTWHLMPPSQQQATAWQQFRLTRMTISRDATLLTTDDWPMLYLRTPMIPGLSLRGAAIMAAIALLLLAPFFRRGLFTGADGAGTIAQMFFLGAGFMLVETKAVVHMALLFGGTWIVNSVVIFAVLAMILGANLFVFAVKPERLAPYYAGLFISLIISALVPMEYFLGLDRTAQIAGSSMLAFVPILFAGVIFAVSFSKVAEPDKAFGANIAGAMFGGLAEYSSMLLGFQYLLLVAVALYLVSLAGWHIAARRRRPPLWSGA
jgi:hypothetical protein